MSCVVPPVDARWRRHRNRGNRKVAQIAVVYSRCWRLGLCYVQPAGLDLKRYLQSGLLFASLEHTARGRTQTRRARLALLAPRGKKEAVLQTAAPFPALLFCSNLKGVVCCVQSLTFQQLAFGITTFPGFPGQIVTVSGTRPADLICCSQAWRTLGRAPS